MKRTLACLVASLSLFGCDPAKEPMSRALSAESAGKLEEAKALYGEVCKSAEISPLCPAAKERIEAISLKEAISLVDQGRYGKAKELLDSISSEEGKRAARALSKTRAMRYGLAFEEASASQDKAAARTKMLEIADESVAVAPSARAWLDANGPALLLVEMKAACRPEGKGSCQRLGEAMEERYAKSPEAAEAKSLVAAEYKRVMPLCVQAERLLIQRLEVYEKEAKYKLCVENFMPAPGGTAQFACAGELELGEPKEKMFSIGPIKQAFDKKLEEIHDPGIVAEFNKRWELCDSKGEYDPVSWPKPG